MNSIFKGVGVTASEKYLVHLAQGTFLNLWSYPNVFIDKKHDGRGVGKELCDLLVVCGDDVLIFSDKHISWPGGDSNVAWQRWFKRAIQKSVDQIRGAERWIENFPDKLYLDPECTNRLPLKIPPAGRRKIHGIVVANGAVEACREYFQGGLGSLLIKPSLQNEDHINPNAPEYLPFTVGDVDTSGTFLHVMNEVTLDIAMKELDTVADLTQYLEKKSSLVRSGRLAAAQGEEDLVAYYMTHMDKDEHSFAHPKGGEWPQGERISIDGTFGNMLNNKQYAAKKQADEISYVWDRIIEAFTTPMMEGTTIVPDGWKFELSRYEIPVRYMAQESRFHRRVLGKAISEAMEEGQKIDRFVRIMLAPAQSPHHENGYFFMTLKCPPRLHFKSSKEGYERYRATRRSMLEAYAYATRKRYEFLKRIIGIASEPPSTDNDLPGSSEDLVMLEVINWTPELEKQLEERCRLYNILQKAPREHRPSGDEWPS